jgi:hypothetical protein
MNPMYNVLNILVWTLSITIIAGLIGVFFGKVDAQFIEGLVSGTLVTLITMLIKDIMNEPDPQTTTKSTVTTPTTEVSKT